MPLHLPCSHAPVARSLIFQVPNGPQGRGYIIQAFTDCSGLASLFVQFACLPDERHITGPRSGIATIVDLDRICAGHLDVNVVVVLDVHDVVPCYVTGSTGDDGAENRFQADPLDSAAGNM